MVEPIESASGLDGSDPRAFAGVGAGPLRPGERVTLTDAKGRTVAVPAAKVAYLDFTSDLGRKVGFGLAASEAATAAASS